MEDNCQKPCDVPGMTILIQSNEFQAGIQRLLVHNGYQISEFSEKMMALKKLRVQTLKVIKSKFIDIRNGSDVTKNPLGSLCLLDEEKMVIFLSSQLPSYCSYQSLIPPVLNNFLNGAILDLLPVSQILSNKNFIHHVLDLYNIPSLGDDGEANKLPCTYPKKIRRRRK